MEKNMTREEAEKYCGKSARELTDTGVCPTCVDRASGGKIYGDDSRLKFYEDDDIFCSLVASPRAEGHLIVGSVEHYQDMASAPDGLTAKIMRFAKRLMNAEIEIYGCERVYLCTMCDGKANHYHVQLIPRYASEERGSRNFVKPRGEYVYSREKFEKLAAAVKDIE